MTGGLKWLDKELIHGFRTFRSSSGAYINLDVSLLSYSHLLLASLNLVSLFSSSFALCSFERMLCVRGMRSTWYTLKEKKVDSFGEMSTIGSVGAIQT